MVSVYSSGSFKKTEAFLNKLLKIDIMSILEKNGQLGVDALENATPVDSGLASNSWGFEVSKKGNIYSIVWTNNDIENGFPVAIMLQYGYSTGTGGYVQGENYINPAIKPVFDKIANEVWKAVTSA